MKPLGIIFAGTPEFAVPALQSLINSPHEIIAVFTQPDRPAGRGRKLLESPIKQLALQHQLLIKQPENLKKDEIQQEILNYKADLMIVVAYGQLLPQSVLIAPRYGCINIHASLLPRWRGAAPIAHAILAGDKETGICIMQMNVGLDTGPVYCHQAIPILKTDTAKSLQDKLAILGAELLMENLAKIIDSQLKPFTQNDADATYAAKIRKDQARINWHQSAEIITRVIRAFNPWPVAYTTINDIEPLRIWQADIVNKINNNSSIKPGSIIYFGKEGIDVMTGKGIIRLLQIQFPGGKILPISDMLNSRKDFFLQNLSFT